MFHYKTLNDDTIIWDGMNFPAGNRDIDRLEENNKGLISINVYEPDDLLNEEKNCQNKNYQSSKRKISH